MELLKMSGYFTFLYEPKHVNIYMDMRFLLYLDKVFKVNLKFPPENMCLIK